MFPRRDSLYKHLMAMRSASAFADGEEDDEDEDNGDGDGSSGAEDGDGDNGSADGDKKPPVKNPEKKAKSDEAAKYRTQLRKTEKEREALQAKLREFEDKDKTELEKAQRDLKEATEKAADLETKLSEAARELSLFKSGAMALLHRPDEALKLMDLSDVKTEEDGTYNKAAVLEFVQAWLKDGHEHYSARDDSGDDDGKPSGRPAKTGKKPTDEAKVLREKYPALNGR